MFEHALSTFDDAVVGPATGGDPGGGLPNHSAAEATSRDAGRTGELGGDWRAVLEQVDLDRLVEFTVAVPPAYQADRGDLRLEFSRSHGVVLRAGRGHTDEIRRAVSALTPAIDPGVPRWSWLYTEIAEIVGAIIIGVVIELAWLGLSRHFSDPDVLDFLPLPVGFLVALGALTLLRRWFPRFRVSEAPER
jgi:hypothetical protein